jgi:hypothetical protein
MINKSTAVTGWDVCPEPVISNSHDWQLRVIIDRQVPINLSSERHDQIGSSGLEAEVRYCEHYYAQD